MVVDRITEHFSWIWSYQTHYSHKIHQTFTRNTQIPTKYKYAKILPKLFFIFTTSASNRTPLRKWNILVTWKRYRITERVFSMGKVEKTIKSLMSYFDHILLFWGYKDFEIVFLIIFLFKFPLERCCKVLSVFDYFLTRMTRAFGNTKPVGNTITHYLQWLIWKRIYSSFKPKT